jgi:short-chain fatty acids transporter
VIAYHSAPAPVRAQTAEHLGIEPGLPPTDLPTARRRPGEWLEYSPILTLVLVALACGFLINEFATKTAVLTARAAK